MMKNARFSLWLACLGLIAVSCAPRKTLKNAGQTEPVAVDTTTAPGVEVGEANIRGGDFSEVSEVQPVYFEYDAYSLSEQSRATLRDNAAYLKDHPDAEALVAGYCDERGTTEYNLALGQRRAKELREYYIRLGLPSKSIGTISYGKEHPVCTEATEDCWRKNRRAVTRVRIKAAATKHQDEDTQTAQ